MEIVIGLLGFAYQRPSECTVINSFHNAKPEHFCPLLLVDADAELQKVSQQKNGLLLKGTVKLSTEGLDEESKQAQVELKDYGQFPWGQCKGADFTPVLRRDKFLRDMCETIAVLGNSSAGNSCAVTSMTLSGLVGGRNFH